MAQQRQRTSGLTTMTDDRWRSNDDERLVAQRLRERERERVMLERGMSNENKFDIGGVGRMGIYFLFFFFLILFCGNFLSYFL